MSLANGTKLGPYEILAPIGAGGMGEVYRAKDMRLGREVAVKVLTEGLSGDQSALERFEREAMAVAALSHPNILAIHDYGKEGDLAYAVMELLEGETLRERLLKGPLPVSKVTDIANQIAEGLVAAHEKGIVHRDLKPGNVFITKTGRVKILDFGLAKLKSQEPIKGEPLSQMPTGEAHTSAGAVIGTMGYMSPEQARGRPADPRSDIFAFGVILYEMLAGKRAFDGESASDILVALLSKDPDPLPPVTPASLDRVVRRCLEKRPEDRYVSAHELLLALEVASSGQATPAPALAFSTPTPLAGVRASPRNGWLSRHWPKLLVSLIAVTVVAIVAGWAVWFRGAKPTSKSPPLNPKRVAVTAFENQTGDPTLDSLGRMASDSLSQGLSKVAGIETAPSRDGAGRVVSGSYYLQGQTLRFQVKVTDAATGQIVYAPEPFTGPRDQPDKIVDDLGQHVMGAIAAEAGGWLDPLLVTPPTYEAYREFAAGQQVLGSDLDQFVRHMERAAEIDPSFAWGSIIMATNYFNYGECEKANVILDRLNVHREKLTTLEQDRLDSSRAAVAGQWPVALARLQHSAKLSPKDEDTLYNIGFCAAFANMPRLVLETLPDPLLVFKSRQSRVGVAPYAFTVIADPCHLLGDYPRELAVAEKGIPLFPEVLEVRYGKIRALAGLGRAEEVAKTVDEALGASFVDGTPDDLMLLASLELRAHGNAKAALQMAARSVEWLKTRPASVQAMPPYRSALARATYASERWDEAQTLYQQLSREHPLDVGPRGRNRTQPETPQISESKRLRTAIHYLGPLGTLAARRGDRKEAERISGELARVDNSCILGDHTYWRACIASQLGEKEQAVDLLQQAASQGYVWRFPIIMQVYGLAFHASQDLEPLHGYPPYEELLKPKG